MTITYVLMQNLRRKRPRSCLTQVSEIDPDPVFGEPLLSPEMMVQVSLAIGVAAAIWPSWVALRMKVVTALRTSNEKGSRGTKRDAAPVYENQSQSLLFAPARASHFSRSSQLAKRIAQFTQATRV